MRKGSSQSDCTRSIGASTPTVARMPAAMSGINFRVRVMLAISALFAVVPSAIIFASIGGDKSQSDRDSFAAPTQVPSLSSPQVNAAACNDTALYYNLHSESWGVFSRLKDVPSAESLLQTSDTFWVIINWISLPNKQRITQFSAALGIINLLRSEVPTSNMTMKILITDSSDQGKGHYISGSPMNMFLLRLSEMLGADNVYLASRSLVKNRNMGCFRTKRCNHQTMLRKFSGKVRDCSIIWSKNASSFFHNGVMAKWDFAVIETYLPVFDRVVRRKMGLPENATITADDFHRYPRKLDVAHIWDVESNDRICALRNAVTLSLQKIMGAFNLNGTAGLVSPRGRVGRRTTSDAYAEALLGHKIIIVAQRDHWEDHVRLFESLMGGAMVMSDPMTHPPAGLVNGSNIVLYESLDDMYRKIMYYIRDEEGRAERERIARAGWELAMEHHLNRHRYERLMLGDNWPKSSENPVAPLLNCKYD